MADLSILDLSLAKIRALTIDPQDVPALIEAEEGGKTRKSVLTYLAELLPLGEPDEGDEPESFTEVHWEPPSAEPIPDGRVEVECITHNVHFGDGRQLDRGGRDFVTPDLAAFLIEREQVVRV